MSGQLRSEADGERTEKVRAAGRDRLPSARRVETPVIAAFLRRGFTTLDTVVVGEYRSGMWAAVVALACAVDPRILVANMKISRAGDTDIIFARFTLAGGDVADADRALTELARRVAALAEAPPRGEQFVVKRVARLAVEAPDEMATDNAVAQAVAGHGADIRDGEKDSRVVLPTGTPRRTAGGSKRSLTVYELALSDDSPTALARLHERLARPGVRVGFDADADRLRAQFHATRESEHFDLAP